MKPLLLLIDDDNEFISDLVLLLKNDYNCISANTGEEGLKLIEEKSPDLVLLDLMLGDGVNGLQVLKKIIKVDDNLPVIMITDYASIDTAIEAIKIGAFDYISKAPNLKEFKLLVERSLEQKIAKVQAKTLSEEIHRPYSTIIGESLPAKKLNEEISLFAGNDNTVLVTGESGVGKELVARQIHQQSGRRNKPLVAINCAAMPKDLVESELFGHERGAFTGASTKKLGKFEVASGGIIFLDEISELDLNAQVKLLRVLQEKEFERVGGITTIKSNVRVIAATNRNLKELTKKGLFREDLFFRLNVLPINVPSLKDRKEDIPLLANHFIILTCGDSKIAIKKISKRAMELLVNYDWPGNIRELQNHIIRAVLVARDDDISELHLDPQLFDSSDIENITIKIPETWEEMDKIRKEEVDKAGRKIEKLFIENLLKMFDGNISKASEHIGINRTNFHKMMNKCGAKYIRQQN